MRGIVPRAPPRTNRPMGPRLLPGPHRRTGLLLELEDGGVDGVVHELHGELSAGAGPVLVRLPDVVVAIDARDVDEAARSRSVGLLERIARRRRLAGDRARLRVAGREDVQAAVAAEAELRRHGATCLRPVRLVVV